MIRRITLALVVISAVAVLPLGAQVVVPDTNPVTVDFQGFAGAGFVPSPGAGQLDSDSIIVTGLSDGDMTWGGSYTTGDYARGTTAGGVTTGGIYGCTAVTDFLMFQASGSDMTPGGIIMKFHNAAGITATQLAIDYDILVYNDQDRGNTFNVSYSDDGTNWSQIAPYDYTTPGTADASPTWQTVTRSGYVLVVNIPDGSDFYLRWNTDDSTGSGGRDEIGLDNVTVQFVVPTPTPTPTPTPNPVTILTASSLPSGTVSLPYSETLQASGGTPPYTWSVTAGSLPPGLSLSSSTGEISGTPTSPGSYGFTIQVQDAAQATASRDFTLDVRDAAVPTLAGGGRIALVLIILMAGVLIVLRRRTV